jgi:hypothetical protein
MEFNYLRQERNHVSTLTPGTPTLCRLGLCMPMLCTPTLYTPTLYTSTLCTSTLRRPTSCTLMPSTGSFMGQRLPPCSNIQIQPLELASRSFQRYTDWYFVSIQQRHANCTEMYWNQFFRNFFAIYQVFNQKWHLFWLYIAKKFYTY